MKFSGVFVFFKKPRLPLLFLLATLPIVTPIGAQTKDSVSLWLTTQDRSSLFAEQPTPIAFTRSTSQLPTVDVDDKTKFQSIDGFGFALTGGSAQLMMRMDPQKRAELIKEVFSTVGNAIGVSYLRVSIGSSDLNDHVFTYDDIPAGQQDPDLTHFDLGPDKTEVIPVLKEILAINPKIKILASPWSAPSWMKTNENPKGGSLKPEDYNIYAHYLVKYLQAMQAAGIHIDAITIQNEPLNPKNTPSMVVTAPEENAFIKQFFGPQLRKSGLKTRIILYDHNCDVPEYATDILADAETAKYVDGSGFHLYGGAISAMTKVHDADPKKNLYFTEQMIVDRRGDAALRVAAPVKRVIVGPMTNWSRNVLLWNLAADPQFNPHTNNGGCGSCEGAVTIDQDTVTRNLAYYTLAQASKFVRPGSVRIQSVASLPDALANVAFKTPHGKTVLILANTSNAPQSFTIRFRDKSAASSLPAGAVGTYIW